MSISFVLVQCTIGHEMEVLRELLKLDSVKEAKGTFGYYDILVKVIAPTDNDIEKFIASSQISHVTAYYCNINLIIYNHRARNFNDN